MGVCPATHVAEFSFTTGASSSGQTTVTVFCFKVRNMDPFLDLLLCTVLVYVAVVSVLMGERTQHRHIRRRGEDGDGESCFM